MVNASTAFAILASLVGGASVCFAPLPTSLAVLGAALDARSNALCIALLAFILAGNSTCASFALSVARTGGAGSPNPATFGVLGAGLGFVVTIASDVAFVAGVGASGRALSALTDLVVRAGLAGSPIQAPVGGCCANLEFVTIAAGLSLLAVVGAILSACAALANLASFAGDTLAPFETTTRALLT